MTPKIRFNPPPDNLQLTDREVHVFCTVLDQPLWRMEHLAETLSSDERQRAARFHFGKDKNRYVAGRGMLREILGRLLGVEPAAPVFSYGVRGKPRLAMPATAENSLHFNVAHSDSLVVYAVSRRHEVGIDVERIRPVREMEDIAAHIFSKPERAQWRLLADDKKTEAFFYCWVRKEAWLKARGSGIDEPLNQIESSFGGDVTGKGRFSLHSFQPASDFAAALVTKCHDALVHCWSWRGEELSQAPWSPG